MMDAPPTERSITLSFAPDPVLLRVVRLAASSLATDASFTISEIDDLTLAVDELTAALMEVATAQIDVAIHASEGAVRVEARSEGAVGVELNDLAKMIIGRTTDQHELVDEAGAGGWRMTKVHRGDGA